MPNLNDLPELYPPDVTNEVKRIIRTAGRAWSDLRRRIWFTCRLLIERGGLPPGPGEPPRNSDQRVRELAWRLEQFDEMLRVDRDLADNVFAGRELWHVGIMVMTLERGMYEGEFGDWRYEVDTWIQHRLDPTVDVSR